MPSTRLTRLLSSENGRKAYRTWCEDPVTAELKLIAQELSVASPLGDTVSGEYALYYHGQNVGFDKLRGVLFDLESVAEEQEQRKAASELRATYGAEDILKQEAE